MHKHLVSLLALALAAPTASMAQQSSMHNSLKLDYSAFARLQARVGSQDSVRVQGAFGELIIRQPRLTTDSLLPGRATPGTNQDRLALGDVRKIQARGSASGTGALIGAGIGFVGGLAAGLGAAASLCSDGGCSNEAGGVTVITLGSTAAGALIGALIGAPFKKWHTVYRAPPERGARH